MEAIIGALYLDEGWEAAREFVIRVFKEELEAAQTIFEQKKQNKSSLNVWSVLKPSGDSFRT